jgi:two-component system CheB/CheR fusion protein
MSRRPVLSDAAAGTSARPVEARTPVAGAPFLDGRAFEELRTRAIRPLVREKEGKGPLRAWVVGCGTGEDAYALAMAFREELSRARSRRPFQVFATDIDEEALEVARAGAYPESIASAVPGPRLKKFFTYRDKARAYRVAGSLRETIIFARHDLLYDPPFSRLDLVSCRNLIGRLDQKTRPRFIRLLHFSLLPGGILFLGSSEMPGDGDGLFGAVSSKWRIYRRQGPSLRLSDVSPPPGQRVPLGATWVPPSPVQQVKLGNIVRDLLLEEYAPAAILVDREGRILHLHGETGKYLDPAGGGGARKLLAAAREGLRARLRIGLEKAMEVDAAVTVEARVRRNGKRPAVRVTVRPVRSPLAPGGLLLVLLEDSPPIAALHGRRPAGDGGLGPAVQRLDAELEAAKDELRSTVQRMESANEDLRASNVEVLSMNEELQATNEELETSKEELQTVNEELSTLNDRLEEKVGELTETNNDLANLLGSTEIATVFLDSELRIKRFTDASREVLNVSRADIGRPISGIAHGLIDVDLRRDAAQVLRSLTPVRREVERRGGEWFILRALPYRTATSVAGVVMTFTDVTDLVEASRQLDLRERQQELLAVLGRRALGNEAPETLMEDTAKAAAQMLEADLSCIFLRAAEGDALHLRAGTGWKPGLEGVYTLSTEMRSPIAHGFQSGAPLILADLRDDPRFADPDLLRDHEAASGVLVRLESRTAPLGVLGVFTRRARSFRPHDVNFLQALAVVLAETIARRNLDTARLERSQALEAEVERRTAWLSLLQDVTRASNEAESMDVALRYALQRIGSYNGWHLGHSYVRSRTNLEVLVPFESWLDERTPQLARLRDACLQSRPRKGEGLAGKVLATGRVVFAAGLDPMEDRVVATLSRDLGIRTVMAFPVRVERETVAVLMFFSNRALDREDPAMLDLFVHVGTQLGRVVERVRFQEAFAEAIWQEQKRISEELHDNVGQELTGVGLMSSALVQKAAPVRDDLSGLAREISLGVQRASEKIRALARGLYSLEIDAQGLEPALQHLAATMNEIHGVPCRATCEGSADLNDDRTALHLFRIAQEAVTNAVRHARAREIVIDLRRDGGFLMLSVSDDGAGIDGVPREGKGLGLRIMRNRASAIGAVLSIKSAPGKGTAVTCALPLIHHEEGA